MGAIIPLAWVGIVLLFFCFVAHTSTRFSYHKKDEE